MTAMLDLAVHQDEGPITLADISQRQGISLSCWNSCLRSCGAETLWTACADLEGYTLRREPSEIFVAEIVDSVDENVDAPGAPVALTVIMVRCVCLISCGRN